MPKRKDSGGLWYPAANRWVGYRRQQGEDVHLELSALGVGRLVDKAIIKLVLFHTLITSLANNERDSPGDIAVRIADDDADSGTGGVVDDPRCGRSLGNDGRVRVLGEARCAGRFVRAKDGKVVGSRGLGPGKGRDAALCELLLLISCASGSRTGEERCVDLLVLGYAAVRRAQGWRARLAQGPRQISGSGTFCTSL